MVDSNDTEPPDPIEVASAPCSMHEVDPEYMGLAAPAFAQAPEFSVAQWFNTADELSMASLRGRVVVVEAFQMLCPGCVSHGIPQAKRIQEAFSPEEVVVLGLHTVFEHHAAMSPVSLQAFLHEYRVTFPVGVDRAHESGMPATMRAYALQGTPTLLLIDARGRLRKHWFGVVSDVIVGAEIMRLVLEQHSNS